MAAKRTTPPDGFEYRPDVLNDDEERELVERIKELRLKEFEFHGYLAKRRVISYGWHYDFGGETLNETTEIPDFLIPLRDRIASLVDIPQTRLSHALITEYRLGTTIGWHRDKAV